MNNKIIYLVRHGNTFDANQVLLRVGCRTDLPLSSSGKIQLEKLAQYINDNNINIDHLYSSNLLRAKESAQIILNTCNLDNKQYSIDEFLNEVDYGIDDGAPEIEVIARIGQQALKDWEEYNLVPDGWNINPEVIIKNWTKFIREFMRDKNVQHIMIVTSNGLAKFLPLALDLSKMPKIGTGSISKLYYSDKQWHIDFWNQKP